MRRTVRGLLHAVNGALVTVPGLPAAAGLRLLGGLALLLVLSTSANAQTLTTVTGTVTDPSNLPYAGAQLVAQLVSPGGPSPSLTPCTGPAAAVGCQIQNPGPVTLNDTGSFTINLWANASILPASTTYSFRVTLSPGVLRPFGTGPQSFTVAGVTIAGATQSLSATLSAAAPALTQMPPPSGYVYASAMKCDARKVSSASWTSGQSTISAAGLNATSADIGKWIWGTINNFGTQRMPLGTIVSVQSATQVTSSASASFTDAGTGLVTLGSDNTNNLRAAVTAAIAAHQPLLLPTGKCFVGKGATGPLVDLSVAGASGFTFQGAGMGANPPGTDDVSTIFYISPDFTQTGTSVPNFISTGSNQNITQRDFAIDDTQISRGGSVATLIGSGVGGHVQRVYITGWRFIGGNDTFDALHVSSGSTIQDSVFTTNDLACNIDFAYQVLFLNIYCGNSHVNMRISSITGNPNGGGVSIVGGISDECSHTQAANHCINVLSNSRDVRFVGHGGFSYAGCSPVCYALHVDGTSQVDVIGSDFGQYGGIAGGAGAGILIDAGGILSMTDTKYWASNAGGFFYISNQGTLYDLGGNRCGDAGCGGTYTGNPPIFPLINNATTQLGGSQVVNGIVPTSCTITGNGTSTCAFDTGSTNAAGRITITAAGATTAVGLVSFNFSATLGTNSSNCSGNYLNGTGTWAIGAVAPIFVTNTTTATSFNINNAGTNLTAASTYKVNYTCYGQ